MKPNISISKAIYTLIYVIIAIIIVNILLKIVGYAQYVQDADIVIILLGILSLFTPLTSQ